MHIDFLVKIFEQNLEKDALVWRDKTFTYQWLLGKIETWVQEITLQEIHPGSVIILEADFSPNSVALLMALIQRSCIIVPLTARNLEAKEQYVKIVQGEVVFSVDKGDDVKVKKLDNNADHDYFTWLRQKNHPGLVLFTSGSTDESKAAVHDFVRLFEKYRTARQNFRTLTFLLYDHIGGIDTLFYSLSNARCIITVPDKSADTVCKAVQDYQVELLPVSPSFLNLLILSQAYERYDLSSLKFITYSSEIMPEATLKRCHEIFPWVKLLNWFGTTEIGTLRAKSKTPDSPWVKIGGEGYDVRVRDGILQIKTRSAILGYLNAPSPFTEDGWFITGDVVECDGDYMRILGRKKEMINVGGEKVNPAEVENVIYEMDNVKEVGVYAEENPILGNIVCAKISLVTAEDHKAFINRVKAHCASKLDRHKVPVRITIVDHKLHSDRFKKMRRNLALGQP